MDRSSGTRLLGAARARFPALQTETQPVDRTTVAVLPLRLVDELGGEFYLAFGVWDELSSRLSRVDGIAISGRTSVQVIAERGGTLGELAKALNVSHLIEGEVRRRVDA